MAKPEFALSLPQERALKNLTTDWQLDVGFPAGRHLHYGTLTALERRGLIKHLFRGEGPTLGWYWRLTAEGEAMKKKLEV
jgi:hypothetical protein